MVKNINDWDISDDKNITYYRTGREDFIFSVEIDEGGNGLITLHNNGASISFESDELSRVGFRRMYCDELVRQFFETNKVKV